MTINPKAAPGIDPNQSSSYVAREALMAARDAGLLGFVQPFDTRRADGRENLLAAYPDASIPANSQATIYPVTVDGVTVLLLDVEVNAFVLAVAIAKLGPAEAAAYTYRQGILQP